MEFSMPVRSLRQKSFLAVLVLLGMVVGCSQEPAGLSTMDQAKYKFNSGRWQEAIATLDSIIASDSKNAEAYLLRGRTRHILGDAQQALADFDHAIEFSPKLSEAHYQRSQALRALGET